MGKVKVVMVEGQCYSIGQPWMIKKEHFEIGYSTPTSNPFNPSVGNSIGTFTLTLNPEGVVEKFCQPGKLKITTSDPNESPVEIDGFEHSPILQRFTASVPFDETPENANGEWKFEFTIYVKILGVPCVKNTVTFLIDSPF